MVSIKRQDISSVLVWYQCRFCLKADDFQCEKKYQKQNKKTQQTGTTTN